MKSFFILFLISASAYSDGEVPVPHPYVNLPKDDSSAKIKGSSGISGKSTISTSMGDEAGTLKDFSGASSIRKTHTDANRNLNRRSTASQVRKINNRSFSKNLKKNSLPNAQIKKIKAPKGPRP